MTAYSTDLKYGVKSNAASEAWVSICETHWGYIIRSDTQIADRAPLIERVAGIAGIAFLIAACASWLVPQVHAGVPADLSTRMASSIGLTLPAVMFLWIAERGLRQEVHVDVSRGKLRQAVCNRNGRVRVLKSVPFEKITSAFIKRDCPTCGAQLFVRLEDGKPIHIASGRETTLRLLHERLGLELRPTKTKLKGWERVGRKLKPAG